MTDPTMQEDEAEQKIEQRRVSVIATKASSKVFRVAEANFAKGNYEKAVHYYTEHLHKCQSSEPLDILDMALAHEKIGDALVMLENDQEAMINYQCAINMLREHRQVIAQGSDSSGSAYPFDAEDKVVKRLSQVLVNTGNIYLKNCQGIEERDKLVDVCDKAVACYKEALPWVQDKHGYESTYSMTLAQRYCKVQDILAKQYAEQDMVNMAIAVLIDSQSIIKPYLQYSVEAQKSKSSKQQTLELIFLKVSINIGELYLQDNRLNDIMELSRNTLNAIGLSEDQIDEVHLRNLHPKTKELVCNMLHNMGSISKTQGLYQDAIVYLKKVVLCKGYNDMTIGNSIQALGEAYFSAGDDDDQALQYLVKAKDMQQIDQATENFIYFKACLSNIATLYERKDDADNSIKYLEDLIQLTHRCLTGENESSELSKTWYRIALIQFQAKKYEDALSSHEKALTHKRMCASDSEISTSLQRIAEIYTITKRYDEACNSYKESLNLLNEDNDKTSVYFELGNVLWLSNHATEAIESLSLCIEISLKCASTDTSVKHDMANQAYCKLGSIYLQNKNFRDAVSNYEKAEERFDVQKNLTEAENKVSSTSAIEYIIYFGLGKAHFADGNIDKSLEYFLKVEDIIKMDNELYSYEATKECYTTIATIYERKSETEQGINHLRELIYLIGTLIGEKFKLHTEVGSIFHLIGCSQFRDKQYNEAIDSHNQALFMKEQAHADKKESTEHDITEDISITYIHLGEIYAIQKKYDEAITHYKKSLSGIENVSLKAFTLCEIGAINLMMESSDAEYHFDVATSLMEANPASLNQNKKLASRTLRHMGCFHATNARFENAVQCYRLSLCLTMERLGRYSKELPIFMRESGFCFEQDAEALEVIYDAMTELKIETLCMDFYDYFIVIKSITKKSMEKNDLESCIVYLKASINVALLFLNEETILDKEIAKSLHRMGCIYSHLERYDDALIFYELSLSFKTVYSPEKSSTLSETYLCIADTYNCKGMYQEALNNYRQSLRGAKTIEKLIILDKMGCILCNLKRFKSATDTYKSALYLCQRKKMKSSKEYACLLNNLGNVHFEFEKLDEALFWYKHAQSMLYLHKEENPNHQDCFINVCYNIAIVYCKKKDRDKALSNLKEFFLLIRLKEDFSESKDFAITTTSALDYVGNVLFEEYRYTDAIKWYEKSIELLKSTEDVQSGKLSGTLSNLGYTYCYLGKTNTAMKCMKLSMVGKVEEKLTVAICEKCACIYYKLKNYGAAMSLYQKSLSMRTKLGDSDLDVACIQHKIALVHCKKNQFSKAQLILTEVLHQKKLLYGDSHPEVAKVLMDLGSISLKVNEYRRAKDLYNEAELILKATNYPITHPYLRQYKNALKILKRCTLTYKLP